MKRQRKIYLLPIICFLTVLIYINFISENLRNIFLYILWVVAFGECLITCRISFSKSSLKFIYGGIVLFALVFFLELITKRNYIKSSVIYSLGIALFIYICGCFYGNEISDKEIIQLCYLYFGATLCVSLYLFSNNIATGFNLDSSVYIAGLSKNSVGQIMETGIFILLLVPDSKESHSGQTVLKICAGIFLVSVLLVIRSRTTILCFFVSLVIILIDRLATKKKRLLIMMGIVLFSLLLLNSSFRYLIIDKIFLAYRDSIDLDSVSSGRISIYRSFSELIHGFELTGIGATYYESFYLSTIIQFGFFVGLLFDLYIVWVIILANRQRNKYVYSQLLFILAVSYSMNGLFEGLAPLGPGTKNFFLWFLLGVSMSSKRSIFRSDKSLQSCGIITKQKPFTK